jgi:tol-pal system protein YbgF
MIGSTHLPHPGAIRAGVALCALAALALPAFAPAASAQSRDVQQLIDRMDRLERELGTVQRQAFGGRPPPPGAAAAAPEGSLAQIQVRLGELEGVLAAITGRLEELTFQNQSLQNRLDKLIGDVDFRLRALEGGAPIGASQAQPQAAPPGGAPASPPAAASQAPGAAQTPAGRTALTVPPPGPPPAQTPAQQGQAQAAVPPPSGQPGVLGTLTQADLAAAQRTQPQQPAPAAGKPATQTAAAIALPPGPAKDQYEFAYNLLRQRNYTDAESAFRQFVAAHKTDELSGNAYYWLGETHYVRRQFEPAAVAFLEGYKGFPKGSKAPDNLLKLGMSLAALNRQGEACTTFARLAKEFPDAPGNLKAVTENERKKLSCPG